MRLIVGLLQALVTKLARCDAVTTWIMGAWKPQMWTPLLKQFMVYFPIGSREDHQDAESKESVQMMNLQLAEIVVSTTYPGCADEKRVIGEVATFTHDLLRSMSEQNGTVDPAKARGGNKPCILKRFCKFSFIHSYDDGKSSRDF